MSDMRHYLGTYQYLGEFKTKEDDTSELEIREFTYYGRHYKPNQPLLLIVHPEEEGYIRVECKAVDGSEIGVGLKEALGNALMDIALLYEELMFAKDPLTKHAQDIKNNLFNSWEMFDVDSQAL